MDGSINNLSASPGSEPRSVLPLDCRTSVTSGFTHRMRWNPLPPRLRAAMMHPGSIELQSHGVRMSDVPEDLIKMTVPLPPIHCWQCKPGNQLFIAERGAVAFEVPEGWVIRHDKKQTLTIHDLPPPADQARLSLTVFRLPPVRGGWGQLPLDKMLVQVAHEDAPKSGKKKAAKGMTKLEVNRVPRSDLEVVWAETQQWKDPGNGRMIRCRQILSRARLVQCLISFDVYADAAEQFQPAWDDLLTTLKLAIPRNIDGSVGN
jgi:hypothetical protein